MKQRGIKIFIVVVCSSRARRTTAGPAEASLQQFLKGAKFHGLDVLDFDHLPLDVPTRAAIEAAQNLSSGSDPRDEDWPKPPARRRAA